MKTEIDSVGLYSAWEKFFTTGEIDSCVLREEVARSWRRCRAAGIDSRAPCAPVRKGAGEIEEILRNKILYIEAALPFMRFLESIVRGTGFILVLTDEEGIVLELFGDDDIIACARENNYVPGCCRSEAAVGTNAIGMALVERTPVQLFGAEHYNIRHHGWTCAAAPIITPDGTLLGCVTLSGKLKSSQLHTLGMVVSAAEAIQNRIREQQIELGKLRDERFILRLLQTANEAIITIDANGGIVYVNHLAEMLLGRSGISLCGQKASDVFGAPQLARAIAGLDSGVTPFEMAYDHGEQRKYLIGRPHIISESGKVLGAVLAVTRQRDFLKNVQNLSGLVARYHLKDMVGDHEGLRHQIEMAKMIARQDCRVLITGETGTGKELLVQGIHNLSTRAHGPFVAINCAALPRDLFEAELLGYKEGAFTSARRGGQIGKFELADGGTLFLDEISQMPLDLQAKLLRVLQDGIVTRLGDTKPVPVDVRVIAATNEDLFEKSQHGDFRSDLYFRLSSVELCLPPLRDRGDDIYLLTEFILSSLRQRLERPRLEVSPEAMAALRSYQWPGNIRELENVLEMAAITSEGATVRRENLPTRVRSVSGSADTLKVNGTPRGRVEPRESPSASEIKPIRDVAADVIRNALTQHNGKIATVSRELGISRSTIYRRMRDIGIHRTVSMGADT